MTSQKQLDRLVKKLIFSGLLAFLTVNAFSQSIPQNANTITITIPDSLKEDTYRSLANHLTQQGYNIEKSDKELGYINTERKTIKWSMQVRILASIQGKTIHFTGRFLSDTSKDDKQIQYTGLKNAMYKTCFNEVARVANLFPHETIEYIVK